VRQGERRADSARLGDIFEIPIDDTRVGYGQVVAVRVATHAFCMVVFERIFEMEPPPSLEVVVGSDILLVANTFDSRIKNGSWTVVGRREPDLSRVPFPAYKLSVGAIDDVFVVSYDGKRRRRATPEETSVLDFRWDVAPIRLEKALKAFHGLLPWDDDYARLGYQHAATRATIEV